VHAAGNVWSDYFDYKQKVDADDTYGVKLLTSGQFTPKQFMRLSLGLQVAAVVLGLLLVARTGLPLLWIGLIGIALSLLYPTLKYHALGDVVIFCCYALLPSLGTTFVAAGAVIWHVIFIIVPIGLLTMSILHANNTRDIDTDRRAGIKTFAMKTGREMAGVIYQVEVILPYIMALSLAISPRHASAPAYILLTLLSLPLAWKNYKAMDRWDGTAEGIARLDEQSAQLQMIFSLLTIAGLLLATYL